MQRYLIFLYQKRPKNRPLVGGERKRDGISGFFWSLSIRSYLGLLGRQGRNHRIVFYGFLIAALRFDIVYCKYGGHLGAGNFATLIELSAFLLRARECRWKEEDEV